MLLSLANELKVLPTDLNRLLIIVVVLSMALTPFLAEAGKRFAESTIEDDSDGVSLYHDLVHCWTALKGHCSSMHLLPPFSSLWWSCPWR